MPAGATPIVCAACSTVARPCHTSSKPSQTASRMEALFIGRKLPRVSWVLSIHTSDFWLRKVGSSPFTMMKDPYASAVDLRLRLSTSVAKRTTFPLLEFAGEGSAMRSSADTNSMCTSSPPIKSRTSSFKPTFLWRKWSVWQTESSSTSLSLEMASANHSNLPAMWFWKDLMSRSTSVAIVLE